MTDYLDSFGPNSSITSAAAEQNGPRPWDTMLVPETWEFKPIWLVEFNLERDRRDDEHAARRAKELSRIRDNFASLKQAVRDGYTTDWRWTRPFKLWSQNRWDSTRATGFAKQSWSS